MIGMHIYTKLFEDRMVANLSILGSFVSVILLVIILFILLINIRKRTAAESATKAAKLQLENNYIELEAAYEEVTATQTALEEKYEELKRSEEKVKRLAFCDYLTDLPNRTAFTEKLTENLKTIGKEESIALMYVDLDNFKMINDTLGHSYGDELLIDVTDRLKQVVDENDFLARFGGDEFIILSQNIEDIGTYDEKIKKVQKVFSYPFVLAMKEFFITISIGICLAPKDGKTTQTLIKNVDAAMYAAKGLGKNTHSYYDESIHQKLMEKIEIQSELRNAIEKGEFVVYYQAQIDLHSNKIVGFEALIRWNHPTKGMIPPLSFIGIAEETGLIVPIGRWVLMEACKMLRNCELQGHNDVTMAVNLSARQFKDVELVQMVKDTIEATGIDPEHLELEITESIALDDLNYSVDTIQKLSAMGIKFSLDDFGTGYSSMNYLKRLPVSNLKIDKSFLDTVIDDTNDQKIVTTIINLAQALNLDVIAEGVESNEQEQFLKGVNCNRAQGYLYSRPIPMNETEELFKKEAALND
jgi:diguanylate cyclase (GGDEF) domain